MFFHRQHCNKAGFPFNSHNTEEFLQMKSKLPDTSYLKVVIEYAKTKMLAMSISSKISK